MPLHGHVADVEAHRRPAALGARAVVVCPDQLVEEALAAEYLVEQQLAVVRLAIVDVEVQRSLFAQQPVGMLQARREEAEIVVEGVAVGGLGEQARAVAPSLKADPLPLRVADHGERLSHLRVTGVERRVDVDQLKGAVGERRQQRQVLAQQDLIGLG